MPDYEPLPEHYVTDDRQRLATPTYEALAQCQIIMTSAETGITGPTLIEPGEIFSTEAAPCKDWKPLNHAAGERYDIWLNSLPVNGQGIAQGDITEAAYIMRPREGEAEIPHDQWWSAVMKLAGTLRDKRQGNTLRVPLPAQAHRPGGAKVPVMPFAAGGAVVSPDLIGRAPDNAPRQHLPGTAQRRRPQSPMPNSSPSNSPAQTTG